MATPAKKETTGKKVEQQFMLINLNQIKPHPDNPRRNFAGRQFDELVASVTEKGVIQPIQVRPVKGRKGYQIVFGERRFRASCEAAKANGGLDQGTIPALVREMTDDEAFDLMTIENLQRQDLTDLEEALGFKGYIDRHGDQELANFAERIGISVRYIRRRVVVLGLPKEVLDAWEKGEIWFGHLEQLARLNDNKLAAEFFKDMMKRKGSWQGLPTVADLKRNIDHQSPMLSLALFDLKQEGCISCPANSDVQKKLFDIDGAQTTACLKPKCFKQKQNNWLLTNWQEHRTFHKLQTNGFRFDGDISWGDFEGFNGQPPKACKECKSMVSVLHLSGGVLHKRVCIGDKACHKKMTAPKKDKSKSGDGESTGPRVAWHGEFFREAFYQQRLPAVVNSIKADDLKILQLSLASLVHSNGGLYRWFGDYMKTDLGYMNVTAEILRLVMTLDKNKVQAALHEAALQVAMQETYGAEARRLLADYVDIDLSKEWRISEEYLTKKTRAEILAIGDRFKVFENKQVQEFMQTEKMKTPDKCKKAQLVDVFLKSGLDLAGIVPDEILARTKGG